MLESIVVTFLGKEQGDNRNRYEGRRCAEIREGNGRFLVLVFQVIRGKVGYKIFSFK